MVFQVTEPVPGELRNLNLPIKHSHEQTVTLEALEGHCLGTYDLTKLS